MSIDRVVASPGLGDASPGLMPQEPGGCRVTRVGCARVGGQAQWCVHGRAWQMVQEAGGKGTSVAGGPAGGLDRLN
jgi:hypothetical protein